MESANDSNDSWCQELYEAKSAGFVLYGRALGLSHSESEDVLQETFVALLNLENPPREPEYYALRSFRNRATNYRRSLWRRVTRELESHRWFERTEQGSAQEEEAIRALARLPAEQREAVVLKIWHAYTFEEIGRILDISPNTVAGRYRYGLQKIKATLTSPDHETTHPAGEPLAFLKATATLSRG